MNDKTLKQYYKLEDTHWWFSGMRIVYRKLVERFNLGENDSLILDVGCGPGIVLKDLMNFGNVFGFDKSGTALDFCKKRGIGNRVFQACATNIPIKANSIDCVTSFGVIEHIENEDKVLSELFRVCKPGAKAVLMTSAFKFLWSYHDEIVGHKRRYSLSELKVRLNLAGFVINKISYINLFIFPGVFVARLFQKLVNFNPKNYEEIRDVFVVPRLINFFLKGVLALEASILPFLSLPFGINIVAVIQKPND